MSTNKSERLTKLIDDQESILLALKAEAKELESSSVVEENEQLTKQLDGAKSKIDKLSSENESLKKELSTTKSALFTKLAQEKLSVFARTQRDISNTYFKESEALGNRLYAYKDNCEKSIKQTAKAIDMYGKQQYDDIALRLKALSDELDERSRMLDEIRREQMKNAEEHNNKIGESFKNEPLTENEKRAALKQKSVEAFIGLNLLSKAGILLFLIGIIMLGRFAYDHLNDTVKGSLIFLLGAVLIGIGEYFNKKEKTVFSTALISGGVSVLYAATATGYFAFGLYSVKITFLLCVAVTAIAILLSNQLKSEVVCAFGAVGGYLPVVVAYMISFGKAAADITFIPVSGVYFCLLAAIIFVMTYNKKWYAAQFIGYSLHLIALGGIASCAWAVRNLNGYGYALPFAVGFAIASFVIYLLMPASKIVRHKPLTVTDTVLLGLNTLSGAISVSVTLKNCFGATAAANRAEGFVFLFFAALYGILTVFAVREKSEASRFASAITSISALVFSMLVVPMLFGWNYAPIAWAIEGAVLAVISIGKHLEVPELAGLSCIILSAIAYGIIRTDFPKPYSLLSIISVGVIVSAFWIYSLRGLVDSNENHSYSAIYIVFEIVSAIGAFGYAYYLYECLIHGPAVTRYSDFTDLAVGIIIALCIALVLRLGVLKNKAGDIFSDIVGLILVGVTFFGLDLGSFYDEVLDYNGQLLEKSSLEVINLVLLIVVNIAVVVFFARAASDLINRAKLPAWLYTAAISVSSLMLITATLTEQFMLSFSSYIISAVYIAAACILLFIGFKKNFTVVRSGGLVLVLVAFAKLCFVDTFRLETGWKIPAYFAFGAILILISYFYQRFSKKLEGEAQAIAENSNELTDN